jgi:hypothetical protein
MSIATEVAAKSHAVIANELAALPASKTNERAVAVGQRARQGDVLVTSKSGECEPGKPTPDGGFLVRSGRNGEHRRPPQ